MGADGNNSMTRRCLFEGRKEGELTRLPVYCLGMVRHFTEEQIAPIRAIDPLLFQSLDPETGTFMWFSLQGITENPDASKSYKGLVIVSWLIKDDIKDAMPKTDKERVAYVKRRVEGYAEPLRRFVACSQFQIKLCPFNPSSMRRLHDITEISWYLVFCLTATADS